MAEATTNTTTIIARADQHDIDLHKASDRVNFGSIRERVAMQNRGVNSNIIIADYQVITDRDTTEHIEDNVLNLVLDYMAAGIDPNKTMIFTHSAVPAENQLMLPFLSLVTEAELHRNPTVKSEMEASGHALTGLLLTYRCISLRHPVLQGQRGARRS